MSSRDKILNAVKTNQPAQRDLPPHYDGPADTSTGSASASGSTDSAAGIPAIAPDLTPGFIAVLEAIGGAAYLVSGYGRIATILREQYPTARRIITTCPELKAFAAATTAAAALSNAASNNALNASSITPGDPHALETVDLAILPAHFGVAENGACWITESQMIERVLPFITQNLALVIPRQSIVATMHQAYDRIAGIEHSYGFSTFIAGPSKTADIEQSLVLGAHGPRSLTVFLVDDHLSDAGFY